MLIDDFYTIVSQNIGTTEAAFALRLNRAHPILAGHFPEQPIVPGAVLTQIACNLFSQIVQQKMALTSAKNIKFLNIVFPDSCTEIKYNIRYEKLDTQCYNVTCHIHNDAVQFAKLSLVMQNEKTADEQR